MTQGFTELVEAYLQAARDTLRDLEQGLGTPDLLRSWKLGRISQTGEIAGLRYEMHGLGCLVVGPDHRSIDFDFADDNLIGFDAWRLWKFAREADGKWSEYDELSFVEREVAEAEAAGAIRRSTPSCPGVGSSSTYRLAF